MRYMIVMPAMLGEIHVKLGRKISPQFIEDYRQGSAIRRILYRRYLPSTDSYKLREVIHRALRCD